MLNEIRKTLEFGGDVEFSVCGRTFTAFGWTDDGITIGEQNTEDNLVFPDVDTLFAAFEVGGKSLNELAGEIYILFSSGYAEGYNQNG